jgi:hypothetical protein
MRALALIAFLAGCEKGGGSAPANLDGVVAAWKQEGIDGSGLSPASKGKIEGGTCREGSLDGFETVLCEFASEEAAAKAQAAGLALVGETTGLSLVRGKLLLVVADRNHTDPSGKRLNKIAQTFRKTGKAG